MNGGGFTVSDIVQLAEHKLCGSYNFQPAEVDHLLAILGQRFGLDISSSHPNAVKHVEAGVASHMRICRATKYWGPEVEFHHVSFGAIPIVHRGIPITPVA